MKLKYVKCLKGDGKKFITGKQYPIINYNNGVTILGELDTRTHEYYISEAMANYDDGTIRDFNYSNNLIFSEDLKPKREDSKYSICININKDLVDFFKNNLWITKKSKKDYINDLIRKDFYNTIGASDYATEEQIKDAWNNYKKRLGI